MGAARYMPGITKDNVREIFSYDPKEGILRWRIRPKFSNKRPGDIAGNLLKKGYRQVQYGYDNKPVHRVIWLYVYGEWPKNFIDHIDGDPTNNKIANLRDVPPSVNLQNQRKAQKGSFTGILGVYPNGKKFKALIQTNNKVRYLGTFPTTQEAYAAYTKAKKELHHINLEG